MPTLQLTLTAQQALALQSVMATGECPGDALLTPVYEELGRYLAAMDDWSAEAALEASAAAPGISTADLCPF